MTAAALQTTWEPEVAVLSELAGYLRDALSAHNPVAQRKATLVSTLNMYKPHDIKRLLTSPLDAYTSKG